MQALQDKDTCVFLYLEVWNYIENVNVILASTHRINQHFHEFLHVEAVKKLLSLRGLLVNNHLRSWFPQDVVNAHVPRSIFTH